MEAPSKAQQWVLNKKPIGMTTWDGGADSTFVHKSVDLPSLQSGQVLLKVLYISNDPAQRGWIRANMDPERLYVTPVAEGEVMRARSVAEVLESKTDNVPKGAKVLATTGWCDYAVMSEGEVQKVQELPGLGMTHYLGSLGMTGMTAYYGLVDIAETKPADTVVVSGAAGATGSMVVQIAKHIISCKKVIGIAGTDDKCKWVESLGADVCLNYKSPNFEAELKKATTPFPEVYFDNVGGPILDLMLGRLARGGRIAACGQISSYNDQDVGIKNAFNIVSQRLKIQGFIVTDNMANFGSVRDTFVKAIQEKKLKVGDENETFVKTKFEDVPKTWNMLFSGSNQGKLITDLT